MGKLGRYLERRKKAKYWKQVKEQWQSLPDVHPSGVTNTDFTIGITTYVVRFESCLKPLIKQLSTVFPDTTILIAVNGHHDQDRQEKYLNELQAYLKNFPNITAITHKEPVGLTKLWNELIIQSNTYGTLVLNDDLTIDQHFRNNLEVQDIREDTITIINRSWSHFYIPKSVIRKVGWFDERFTGIGTEDWDYECRMNRVEMEPRFVEVKGVLNEVLHTPDYSFGPEMDVVNEKYSKANLDFFHTKWDVSETEKPGYRWVRIVQGHVKRKPGMETPDFYPEITIE